jgi:hypothetical protein
MDRTRARPAAPPFTSWPATSSWPGDVVDQLTAAASPAALVLVELVRR